MRKEEVHNK
jgi:hypothetical protein